MIQIYFYELLKALSIFSILYIEFKFNIIYIICNEFQQLEKFWTFHYRAQI